MKTPKWPLCLNAFLWPWDLMWCHQWTQNCPCIRIWSNILKVNICGQFDLTSGLFLKGNCIWAACSMLRERKGSGLGRLQKGRAVVKALLLSWCTCIVRTEPLWRVWFQCLWVLNHCDVWFQYMWELNHCDACDFSTCDNWTIVMCVISVHVRIEPLWCVWFQYMIRVEMKRSLLNKDLQKQCEFIIEYKSQADEEKAKPKPVTFTITPETLVGIKEVSTALSCNLWKTGQANQDTAI